MLRSIRSRSLPGASCYLPLLLSLCIPSLLLPGPCAHHCSEPVPVIHHIARLCIRRDVDSGSAVRRPLPESSHRHHVWRLSTPCVDFTDPVKWHFRACLCGMQFVRLFFLECFRKSAGDCQSKTSILVQDAGYSLRRVLILILLPYKRAVFSSRRDVTASDP